MKMNNTRFEQLLEAYGARWSAWPVSERDAARNLMASSPDLQALWEEATDLDLLLDKAPAAPVSAALREQIIASAAGAGLRARRASPVWAWISGAGVAATAFAGAAFGVMIAHQINTAMHADNVLYQASLNATDDTEVLGFEMAALSPEAR